MKGRRACGRRGPGALTGGRRCRARGSARCRARCSPARSSSASWRPPARRHRACRRARATAGPPIGRHRPGGSAAASPLAGGPAGPRPHWARRRHRGGGGGPGSGPSQPGAAGVASAASGEGRSSAPMGAAPPAPIYSGAGSACRLSCCAARAAPALHAASARRAAAELCPGCREEVGTGLPLPAVEAG